MTNPLKTQRYKTGLTLEELSALTHIHLSKISRIENNKRHLRAAELPIFAEALGCTILQLLTPVPETHSVAQCLRAARRRKGLSQAKLAAAIGVPRHAIDRYERGQLHISSARLERLTHVLALKPGEAWEGCPCLRLIGPPQACPGPSSGEAAYA